ncbi:MAG: hypothetical protein MI922_17215 [Bacteroidales bacterium]|nr:hypothetical protein [Bacteroidales bacterium]
MKTLKLLQLVLIGGLIMGFAQQSNAQWIENANGMYYDETVKSVGIGTTPSTAYKLFINSNDANDRRYTIGAFNGFSSTSLKRGIYNSVSNSTSTQYGLYNSVSAPATSSGQQRGIYNYVYGGTGTNYGSYNYLYNRGSAGYAENNYLYDYQTNANSFGTRSEIYTNATTGGSKYGFYSYLRGNAASSATSYGLYSDIITDGSGAKYGVYSNISSTGSGTRYGLFTRINSSGTGTKFGIYSDISSTDAGTKYGLYSRIGSSSNGTKIGLYSYVNTAGTGTKYGVYSYAPGTTAWAGYFYGRTYFHEAMGIGTTAMGSYLLAVDGNVGIDGKLEADEIEVLNVNLPDYVFADDYKLRSLNEVESYINEHSHLPEVPSAEEVATNGMNITEMNNALLKKVEELTLYIIDQNKRIEELEQTINK